MSSVTEPTMGALRCPFCSSPLAPWLSSRAKQVFETVFPGINMAEFRHHRCRKCGYEEDDAAGLTSVT